MQCCSKRGNPLTTWKLLTCHTFLAKGSSQWGRCHTCPQHCCSGNSYTLHSLLWGPRTPSPESVRGTKKGRSPKRFRFRIKTFSKTQEKEQTTDLFEFYMQDEECHEDGRHLHWWGPEGSDAGFQEPSCVHLGINTHRCFPCKTPDTDDKCRLL